MLLPRRSVSAIRTPRQHLSVNCNRTLVHVSTRLQKPRQQSQRQSMQQDTSSCSFVLVSPIAPFILLGLTMGYLDFLNVRVCRHQTCYHRGGVCLVELFHDSQGVGGSLIQHQYRRNQYGSQLLVVHLLTVGHGVVPLPFCVSSVCFGRGIRERDIL